MRLRHLVPLLLIVAASGCRVSEQVTAPVGLDASHQALRGKRHDRVASGFVYVQTNAVGGNAVMTYPRRGDGTLGTPSSHPTGGTGTGGGLGNQGGVILSPDGRLLFTVNAGSNEISSFRVLSSGLRFVGRVSSGGTRPISLTAHGDQLFVLNAGGEGNIAGFRIRRSGDLERIRRATRPLSGSAVMAAQIGFAPDGEHLVVTERATNRISLYTLGRSQALKGPYAQPSNGRTPFGFDFDRGTLIVAEAEGGAPGASAASSYRLEHRGGLRLVSPSVPTLQGSACWLAVSPGGRFAYTANTGSGNVTGFRIDAGGALTRLQSDGVTAVTGGGPADLAFGGSGRYLYVRNGASNSINVLRWRQDGGLEVLGEVTGLPAGASGLAAS